MFLTVIRDGGEQNELGKEDQGDFASMLQSPKSGSPGGEKKKTAQEKLKDFTDGLYVRSIGLLIGFPMFIPLAVLSYRAPTPGVPLSTLR